MLVPNRDFRAHVLGVAATLSLVLGACAGTPVTTNPGVQPTPGPRREGAPTRPPLESRVQADQSVVDPSYEGLSHAQKLDRVLTLPGRRGFVRGTTGTPVVLELPGSQLGLEEIMTDFPFTVHEYMGRGESPYAVGSVISLRVPGGQRADRSMVWEGAPNVRAGQELIVDVRDQGQIAGGNAPARQVVSSTADVFEVRGGTVIGEGAWAGLSEPLATIRDHFRN